MKRKEKQSKGSKSVNKRSNDFLSYFLAPSCSLSHIMQDHLLCQRRTYYAWWWWWYSIFFIEWFIKMCMCQNDDDAHMRTFLQPTCFDVNGEQWNNMKEENEPKRVWEREKRRRRKTTKNGSEDKICFGKTFAQINPHAPGKMCVQHVMYDRKISLDYRYWGESFWLEIFFSISIHEFWQCKKYAGAYKFLWDKCGNFRLKLLMATNVEMNGKNW